MAVKRKSKRKTKTKTLTRVKPRTKAKAKGSKSKRTDYQRLDRLPDEIYLMIMTKYDLSVQDIENVRKSGLDSRTDLALAKLEHAIIRDNEFGMSSKELIQKDLKPFFTKLPQNLKSIAIFEGSFMIIIKRGTIKSLAKQCPNLESLPFRQTRDYLEYINTVGFKKSNLKEIHLSMFRSNGHDAIFKIIRSSPCLEVLNIRLTPSAITDGLLDVIKERSTLRKLTLAIDFTPNVNSELKISDLITSLPTLQKLVLEPMVKLDSNFILFCLEQNFKTELDLQFSRVEINEIPSPAKASVTSVALRTQSLNELKNFPNLRELKVNLNPNEDIPEILCDIQLMPKVTLKLSGFYYSTSTKKRFTKFMKFNGHRLTFLSVTIVEEVSQFVKLLSKATKLDQVSIEFNSKSYKKLSMNDAKTIYRIAVRKVVQISTNSDTSEKRLKQLFKKASKKISNKKCLILPANEVRRILREPNDEPEDDVAGGQDVQL